MGYVGKRGFFRSVALVVPDRKVLMLKLDKFLFFGLAPANEQLPIFAKSPNHPHWQYILEYQNLLLRATLHQGCKFHRAVLPE